MMDTETITSLIRDALPEADIDVRSDDGGVEEGRKETRSVSTR